MLVPHEHETGLGRGAALDLRRTAIGRERLETGIDGDERGMIGADHARIDRERGFERALGRVRQVAVEILPVHEDIGARLELGEDAELEIDAMRAGARSRDDPGSIAGIGERGDDGAEIVGPLDDRRAALGIILDMLLRAAIKLDAAIDQARRARDRIRQRDRVGRGGDAGPVDAGIDIDHHVERRVGRRQRVLQPRDDIGIVDHRHQPRRAPRQRRQARDRGGRGDRRGDQQPRDPAIGQHLGLADLGAA